MLSDVLLIADYKIMRDGLRAILDTDGVFHVVGEAESENAVVEAYQADGGRIVILDLDQSQPALVAGLGEMIRQRPDMRLVVLSTPDDEYSVIAAIRAGVHAFLPKRNSSQKDLLHALRTVSTGGSYLSPHLTGRLLERIRRGDLDDSSRTHNFGNLSRRELQVLCLIATGNTNKEVALQLDLALETVRSYRKVLMKKLGVNNAASVTRLALMGGLVPFAMQSPANAA